MPSLQKLYLSANKLTKLEGLQPLKQLTTLHVRDNQIAGLDGFAPSMEGLQYLNLRYKDSFNVINCVSWVAFYLRTNTVEDVKELQKLKCLPYLRALVLAGILDIDA